MQIQLDKTNLFRCCRRWLTLVAVLAAFGFGGSASAATQYFSGTGIWNTATADWGATGGPYTATWVSGNSAVFEGTAGTVTMAAALPTVAGVTFSVDGYTIQSSTLTIGASGLTLNGNATINSALVLSAAQAWPAGTAGKVLTLGGNLSSSAGNSAMNLSGCPMIKIGANQTWTQSSGGSLWTCGTVDLNGQTLTISKAGGTGSGAATLTLGGLTGSGTVSVQNPNSGTVHGICKINGNNTGFTGTVELKTADVTGQIILGGGANTLGNTTSTFTTTTAGTLDVTAATTLAATVAQNWNADWTFKGTASLNLGTGAVTLGGNRTVTVTNTLTIGGAIDDGVNTYSLTKAGAGTLALNAANTYHGDTTISVGTLALGSTGSINNTPQISIAAGATLDVSAISAYALSSSTSLSAAGTASAATIKGGTTVSLGSQPITLTYDGTHPALTVSQGTLQLNGNAFTVNGTALTSGNYTIAQQTSGNITASGAFTVSGTAIDGTHYGTISVSSGNVVLTVALKPTVTGKTYSRAPGVAVKIYASDLAATATVDSSLGYTPTFDHCDSTTAHSVTLGNNGQSGNSAIMVYPDNAANSGDSFIYTINDGHGGTVSGTVTITINNNVTGQATINLAGQTAALGFFGIPGYHYVVQRSVDSLSNWQDLTDVTTSDVTPGGTSVSSGVITAPSGGAFTVTDPSPPSNPTSVYYQLRAAP